MFRGRITKIQQQLIKNNLDGVLISSAANIAYFSGFTNFSKDEREAYVFIGKNFAYIITDGRYTEAIKKQVPHLTLFERGHKKTTKELFKRHQKEVKRLGIEEDNITVAEHKILSKHFKNIKNFDVAHLRSIKTEEEISKIERACQIGDLAFNFILKKIKVGVTEKEIANGLENFIKGKGADFSFPPIVAFGKNSSVPHHQTGGTVLGERKGQFILLDFGVKLGSYCSDMTRTVFWGEPTDKQKRIYQTVLEAQQEAIEVTSQAMKSNERLKMSEVDKAARGYITSKGYPTIPHSLGHGIGLEVHEHPSLSPKSKDVLKDGMVFSIEPGIYIPDFGSPRVEAGGVRIEDLFVLENNGIRQLTNSPKEIIVI